MSGAGTGTGAGSSDRELPLGTPPELSDLPLSYQQPIIKLGKALGLKVSGSGRCRGFALLSALAGLAPDAHLTSFLRRLNLFKQPTGDLLKKIQDAEAKIQGIIKNKTLVPRVHDYQEAFERGIREPEGEGSISLEEKELFELKIWLTNLALLHSPKESEQFMPQYQQSQDHTLNKEFLMLFAPEGVEANIYKPQLMKFNAVSDLVSWLRKIQDESIRISKPLSVLMGINNHAISINYHPESRQWHFFDANNQPHVFKTEEAGLTSLAQKIRSGLFFEGENGTTYFSAAVMGDAKDPELRNLTQQSVVWTPEDAGFIQKTWKAGLLYEASKNGNIETVQALIAAGAAVNQAPSHGWTALIIAAQNGDSEIVEVLIAAGAAVNQAMPDGWTALMIAAQNGHTETVQALITAKAKVNGENTCGRTALMHAAQKGHTETVAALITAGANVNQARSDEWTALIFAAHYADTEIVQALVTAKAKVNAENTGGWTALMIAAQNGHAEIVKALIEAGAVVDQVGPNGYTALMIAAQNGHAEIVQKLMNADAGIDKANNDGYTALMIAAENGHAEIVQKFMDADAGIDKANNDGWTALMIAAQQGHIETVKLLIKKGAKVNLRAKDVATALSLAIKYKHPEVMQLLIEHGAGAKKDPAIRRPALLNFEHKKISILLHAAWNQGLLKEGHQAQNKKIIFSFLSKTHGLDCFNALNRCFHPHKVHQSVSEIQKSRTSAVTMFDKILNNSGMNGAEKKAARTSFGEALTQLPGLSR